MDQSKTSNVTSKCPICKGVGSVLYTVTDKWGKEYDYAKKCECVDNDLKECRLAFANIPEEFKDLTINSFKTDIYTYQQFEAVQAKKACKNYVENFYEMKSIGKGLYLHSKTKGSGKTRMAVSIANALINHKNTSARFTTSIRIIEEITRTYYDDEADKNILRDLQTIEVLIIDDIGTERQKPFVNEKFYSILNERLINKRVTIFTSNCAIEELEIDERISNRIQAMAIPIKFPEESIRSTISGKENEDILLTKLLK